MREPKELLDTVINNLIESNIVPAYSAELFKAMLEISQPEDIDRGLRAIYAELYKEYGINT